MALFRWLFPLVLVLAAVPASAFDPSLAKEMGKRMHEIGVVQDDITRKSIQMMANLNPSGQDASSVNGIRFYSDLLGSWAGQIRRGAFFSANAVDWAAEKNGANPVLGVFSVTLKNAEHFHSLVLKLLEMEKISDNPQVTELAKQFQKATANGLEIIRALKAQVGEAKMPPLNSVTVQKGILLQGKAKKVIADADGVRKMAKNGLEVNLADEIYLHAVYGHDELSMATETVAYALVFPKRLNGQGDLNALRESMTRYANKLKNDINNFYTRLQRNVERLQNPELKQAHARLVDLNTAMQSYMLDVMRVAATGQDPPAGAQEQGDAASKPARKPEKPAQPNDTPKWDIEGIKPRGL